MAFLDRLGFTGVREWVYTHSVRGRFQRIHRWTGALLVLWLVVPPWLRIADQPAFRVDWPDRRVYALGAIYTASDGFLLLLGLLLATFALFFFTSLYGRLWCGYACPQTVFLEEYIRPIEHLFEGERGRRRRRDQGPWVWDMIWRKVAKWAAFAMVAWLISMAFMGWFVEPRDLWTGAGGGTAYSLVGFFTLGWFLDFAWFREQLCNYVCPYARFQGALADDESLVVSYDRTRGEPRGGRSARTEGACIDCNKCVVVCPQGIDIRDGYQLECIACGRCIDACAGVMGKLGHPSLIGYASEAERQGQKPRLIRTRTVLYGSVVLGLCAAIVLVIAGHQPLEATVSRSPGSFYTLEDDGSVRNTFLLRVANHSGQDEQYTVEVTGLPDDAEVAVPPIALGAGERRQVPIVVRTSPDHDVPSTAFELTVRGRAGGEVRRPMTFRAPGQGG